MKNKTPDYPYKPEIWLIWTATSTYGVDTKHWTARIAWSDDEAEKVYQANLLTYRDVVKVKYFNPPKAR